MRRADRLFQIIQLLRARTAATAAALAAELEVSERTIYRDVRDLVASGVPIDGEAGVGYTLAETFDLPPLMFTPAEIEALVTGARMVEAWGDPDLARQARSVLAKAESVLPDELQQRLRSVGIFVPDFHVPQELTANVEPVRRAIAGRLRLQFDYTDKAGVTTNRVVRPLGLYFWGTSWTSVCWCELRNDFRSFRPDRMRGLRAQEGTFPEEEGRDLQTFLARMQACIDGENDGRAS